jgi:UDP-N-acetylmuramyl pentapeptide phosphotransferase/UDP-N-acetylglucosamine-1-phosphate transferase
VAELAIILGAVWLLTAGLSQYLASPKAALRIVDRPNPRSLHARPTPRTGGLAILGGVMFGLVLAWVLARSNWAPPALASAASDLASVDYLVLLTSAVLLAAVSLWDDRCSISPAVRLSVHVLLAVFLILSGHCTVARIDVPTLGAVPLGWLGYPITLLFIVWMTNLYNFMDGMDGFAGGMTCIGCAVLGCLLLGNGGLGPGLLALIISAASGGFLVFNYPPARIFMGDVGAVPLGFLVGALAIKGDRSHLLDLWTSLIVFSPFIVDASVVLVRRALRGARIWEAHREHHYQRLVLAGWSHRRTVGAEYLLMLGCGLMAALYERSADRGRAAIIVLFVAGYALLARATRAVEARATHRKTLSTPGAD